MPPRGRIEATLRDYLASFEGGDVNESPALMQMRYQRYLSSASALEEIWVELDTQSRDPSNVPVMLAWIEAIEKLKVLEFLEEKMLSLGAYGLGVVGDYPGDTLQERVGQLGFIKSNASNLLILLDSVPYALNLVTQCGTPAQQQRALALMDAFLARGLMLGVRSTVAALSSVCDFMSDPAKLAILNGGGGCCDEGEGCTCNAGIATHLGSINALAGAKYYRTAAQRLAMQAADLKELAGGRRGGGGLAAAVKQVEDMVNTIATPAAPGPGLPGEGVAAMIVVPLPMAVALAVMRQPEPTRREEREIASRAAFNAHMAAKDFVTATMCVMAALADMRCAAEAVGRKEGTGTVAATKKLKKLIWELEESLGSGVVVGLQKALVQRLVVHGGVDVSNGGSGSSAGRGGSRVKSTGGGLWLTDMEARRGMLTLCDPRVVSGSSSKQWS